MLRVRGAKVAVLGLEVVRKRDITRHQVDRHVSAVLIWIIGVTTLTSSVISGSRYRANATLDIRWQTRHFDVARSAHIALTVG